MHPLDIAILITTGLSALFGLWRGLIRTLLPILGLLLGMALGKRYGQSISDLIFGSSNVWQRSVGFIIVVIATLIIATITAWFIRKFLSWVMLSWVDRIAGLIGGALLSLLFWLLILAVFSQIPELREVIAGSSIASFILKYSPILLPRGAAL